MKQGSLFSTIESTSTWTPSAPPILDGIDEIALDVESTGLKWWRGDRPVGLAVGFKRGHEYVTQYLPFAHRGGGNLDENVVKRWAREQLRGKRLKNLNSKFDNHMMHEWGIDLEEQNCVWGDIGHYMGLLHDQRRHGYSLDKISQELIGESKVEFDTENLAEYHAGEVREYAEQDVRLVLKDMDILRPQLIAKKLMRVADLEDQVIYPVCEMERNGAPIDVEKLHAWIKKSDHDLAQCLWALHKMVGVRVDPSNLDDMVRLFRLRGLEIKRWTAGGATREPQPSFTDEILASIKDDAIALVRYARRIISIRSKYLLKYAEEIGDGDILRYSLNQLKSDEGGTISGRFSSSSLIRGDDGEGVNIQQVMRIDKHKEIFGDDYIIRELFIPDSDLKRRCGTTRWLSADARQIEFRLFAHYTRSKRLAKAYQDNPDTDFHNIVWEILKQFDANITRKTTKDINFAEIYGAGVFKTSKMMKISMDRAKEFVEIYNKMFPEAKSLIKEVSDIAKNRGYVMTHLGRRFYFPKGQWLHKALSRVVQGTAADVMKTKTVELHKIRKKTGFKMRFIVHDEVNGDVPDAESARMVAEQLNSQSLKFRIPILWETATGTNWKECKAA